MKKTISDDGVIVLTPPINMLEVPIGLENLTCQADGCNRIFQNSSAHRVHMLKVHGIGTPLEENSIKNKMFACPAEGCERSVDSQRKRFFKALYLLRRVIIIDSILFVL